MNQSAILTTFDPTGSGPAYLRLARSIGDAIARGDLAAGAALPTERKLSADSGLSRVTVRAAYRALAEDGLLQTRAGSGHYVRPATAAFEQPLWRLSSFSDDMARRGRAAGSRLLGLSRDAAAADEASALELAPGGRVVRLRRLRLVDDRPVAIEEACLPEYLADNLRLGEDSLYAALSAQGLAPARGAQRLRAVSLDRARADLLQADEHSAAMLIERVTWLGDGRPIEFTRSHYRGDAYDFVARLDLGELK